MLSKKKLKELAIGSGKYCISIYIPTLKHDNVVILELLKEQISNIKLQASNFGLSKNELDKCFFQLEYFLENFDIFNNLSASLSILINDERSSFFNLPVEVNTFSLVSNRYYLLPYYTMFNGINSKQVNLLKDRKIQPNRIITNIEQVVKLAASGKIHTLFVVKGVKVWGDYLEPIDEVTVYKNRRKTDNCLLDLTARETFFNEGKIFIVGRNELPYPHAVVNAFVK